MGDSLSDIAKNVSKVGENITSATAIQAIDLLGDDEIEELRLLITHDDEIRDFSQNRIAEKPEVRGMYEQLSDLGLLLAPQLAGGDIIVFAVSPKVAWAIGRHDRHVEDERKRKHRELRREILGYLIQASFIVLGWLLGRIG